jgi:[acyl-carrier-protein] S-malonyltransferase
MEKTAVLFAGQGSQVVGMGHDLAERFPAAQSLFNRANEVLGYDLAKVCFEGPDDMLKQTKNAQPGIFLTSWVALDILKSKVPSLKPEAMAGLSLGEFTALTAAGVMSLEDGLKVVRQRGQFMQEACEATDGGMAAIIGLDEAATREVCEEAGAELANLNCPGQLVISGDSAAIEQACELAKEKGAKRALPLTVAGAYHSRLMKSASPKLEAALREIPLNLPNVTVISNVTAQPHATGGEILNRLVEQVTSPVRWEASIRYLIDHDFTRFIELGPGTALTGFIRRIDRSLEVHNVSNVQSLEKTVSALSA